MKQLSGQDAMFLHTELEGFPLHIGGVSILDQSTAPGGLVRFKDILAMFESRLDRSPIFRQKIATVPYNLDQPYWVDDPDFDLEFHVRHIALPKPGDWRQLCIQVARLHSRPLDRSRPLWEAYIIEGLNNVEGVPEGSFALYLKVHHCAVDGATGVQFFGAFNDLSPTPEDSPKPKPWRPKAMPSNSKLLRKAYMNNLRMPGDIFRLARKAMPARKRVKEGVEAGEFREPAKAPSTRFNGKISPHRVVDAVKFDFEEVRAIKSAVKDATINDTVLSIVGGGLRKYLEAKGELPDMPMTSLCPVNVRDDSQKETEGNMVGTMTVALFTDEADPKARLAKVHDEAQSAKSYIKAMGPTLFKEVTDTVPAGLQSLVSLVAERTDMMEKNVMQNTAVTNVPVSPYQLYMCGAAIIDSFGIGPLNPGMGLFHTVNSMVLNKKGKITLAFICCREIMPDPSFYAQCLQESYEELRDACLRPTKKATGKRKAKARSKAKS